MRKFKEKYIGSRQFYEHTLMIAVPMILQNLITNFVSMLDNIMVGQVGTAQMSGVSIANQFIFIFNITIFGGLSGASIFGTQFFGKGDHEGQKFTFRFRLVLSVILILLGASIFGLFGDKLIGLFLKGSESAEIAANTMHYGRQYLNIMILGLIPFGIGQAYASVVRECGETKIPMIGSMAAIGINLFLDYGLIFGKFGMPKMGVAGAAIATVIAKYIEAIVVIAWAHTHHEKNKYIVGLFKGFKIPLNLAGKIIVKGCPLLINEFLWSLGVSIIAQCYSMRGLEVVAASNIASTINNMINVVYIQLGASIGIIVGALLGADRLDEAKDSATKLIFFSVVISALLGLIMIPFAKIFPELYNTEENVKSLASYYIIIQAIAMPIWAYTNGCYFTLRSGGKTGITFLFDFVASWFMMIPLAYVLSHFTNMDIHLLFAIVTYTEVFKAIAGYFMIKSGIWISNIVK